MFFKEFFVATKEDPKLWKVLYSQMARTFITFFIFGLICYAFNGLEFFGGDLKSLFLFIIILFIVGSFLSLFKANNIIKNGEHLQ